MLSAVKVNALAIMNLPWGGNDLHHSTRMWGGMCDRN